MKIQVNWPINETTFKWVEVGDVFQSQEQFFIKTVNGENGDKPNSFNFTTKNSYWFDDDTEVYLCPNATLLINGLNSVSDE